MTTVRRVVRIVLIVLVVVTVLALAAAGIAYWQARSIVAELQAGPKRAEVQRAQRQLRREPRRRSVTRAAEHARGAQTILLIGSDRRWSTPYSARSDTIILARIDATHHRISLLSIPRDLYVPIAGHGWGRINSAFAYGGAGLLIATVRDVFGVKIDHFVEVNFGGFRQLVDTLGGVYLPIEQRYYNVNVHTVATNYANIDLQPGYQKLDGARALSFARFRHTDSDFFRTARQQIFLRAVMRKLLTFSANPFTLRDRARAFARATTSDISSLGELWWLYGAVHSTPSQSLTRETLQAQDLVLGGVDYVQASASERELAVRELYATSATRHRSTTTRVAAPRAPSPPSASAPADLVSDGGEGATLLRGLTPIRRCAPTQLPAGYAWPATDAVRSYTLAGHPAIAAWASAGSGRAVLWMWTTWRNPPTLADPVRTLNRDGRTYSIWTEHGRIRQIAWSEGPTRAWITNTLRDELTSAQMLGLATSCKGLSPGQRSPAGKVAATAGRRAAS